MKLIVMLALMLTIVGCNKFDEGSKTDTAQQPKLAQCTKDTDCKGDRICESGACTNPQATNATLVPTPNSASITQQSRTKISQIFSPKMLSANIEYLEKITGPARQTIGNSRTYDVEGCNIAVFVSNGSVGALKMDLNSKCTFDLNPFINVSPEHFPTVNSMTIGQFDELTGNQGQLLSDCIYMCGNAVDPVVADYWTGPHADQFIEVQPEVSLIDDTSINASMAWEKLMENGEGEDWVINTKFNCERTKYDAPGHELFKNVKLTAITVGYGLNAPHC